MRCAASRSRSRSASDNVPPLPRKDAAVAAIKVSCSTARSTSAAGNGRRSERNRCSTDRAGNSASKSSPTAASTSATALSASRGPERVHHRVREWQDLHACRREQTARQPAINTDPLHTFKPVEHCCGGHRVTSRVRGVVSSKECRCSVARCLVPHELHRNGDGRCPWRQGLDAAILKTGAAGGRFGLVCNSFTEIVGRHPRVSLSDRDHSALPAAAASIRRRHSSAASAEMESAGRP